MLISATDLEGCTIHAPDGELGKVEQFYFDDESWAVRYLVVETGGWFGGRAVLISPYSVVDVNRRDRLVDVSLTKTQVEQSPAIDTHKPVSRQHETEYLGYYGYPDYWVGPYLWGPGAKPAGISAKGAVLSIADQIRKQKMDSHLRSTEAVTGYKIDALDGEIGHVDDFLIDDETWAIRYVEVATRRWWEGKKVLVSPAWIERVSWAEARVCAALTREAIRSAPEYVESVRISRAYEDRLHTHYGRPPYWLHEAGHKPALAVSGI